MMKTEIHLINSSTIYIVTPEIHYQLDLKCVKTTHIVMNISNSGVRYVTNHNDTFIPVKNISKIQHIANKKVVSDD